MFAGVLAMSYVASQRAHVAMLEQSNREIVEEMMRVQDAHDSMVFAVGNQCVEWRPGYLMFVTQEGERIKCSHMQVIEVED